MSGWIMKRFSLLLLYVATCNQEVNHNDRTYEATFLTLPRPKCCPATIQCLTDFTDLIGEPVFSPGFTDHIISHDHGPHLEYDNG